MAKFSVFFFMFTIIVQYNRRRGIKFKAPNRGIEPTIFSSYTTFPLQKLTTLFFFPSIHAGEKKTCVSDVHAEHGCTTRCVIRKK